MPPSSPSSIYYRSQTPFTLTLTLLPSQLPSCSHSPCLSRLISVSSFPPSVRSLPFVLWLLSHFPLSPHPRSITFNPINSCYTSLPIPQSLIAPIAYRAFTQVPVSSSSSSRESRPLLGSTTWLSRDRYHRRDNSLFISPENPRAYETSVARPILASILDYISYNYVV
jgi:hypothetical protein